MRALFLAIALLGALAIAACDSGGDEAETHPAESDDKAHRRRAAPLTDTHADGERMQQEDGRASCHWQ